MEKRGGATGNREVGGRDNVSWERRTLTQLENSNLPSC
jgi:hypothetical protein